MPTLLVSIDVDAYQAKAISLDREHNLFGGLTDADYLAVRIMEYVTSITDQRIYQPQLAVVTESLKANPDVLKAEAQKRGYDIDATTPSESAKP